MLFAGPILDIDAASALTAAILVKVTRDAVAAARKGGSVGIGLVVLILVAVAAGFAAFTASKAESSTAMSFALVLAVAGGAVYIGAEGDVRLLGIGLLLVAVFSATGALLAVRTTQRDHTAR